jgi:hypothetical protein
MVRVLIGCFNDVLDLEEVEMKERTEIYSTGGRSVISIVFPDESELRQ